MTEKLLTNSTVEAAISVLNAQYYNCIRCKNKTEIEPQTAYYKGMKTMLELILTENFSIDGTIAFSDFIGSHFFVTVDKAGSNDCATDGITVEITV